MIPSTPEQLLYWQEYFMYGFYTVGTANVVGLMIRMLRVIASHRGEI